MLVFGVGVADCGRGAGCRAAKIGLIITIVLVLSTAMPAAASVNGYQQYPSAHASALATGPDGAVWFTENNGIGRVTAGGQVTNFAFPAGVTPPDNSGNDNLSDYLPESIVKGPDGRLWFTAQSYDANAGVTTGLIGAVTTGGGFSFYDVPMVYAPQAVAAGPDGRIWFTGAGTDASGNSVSYVGAITTGGSVSEYPVVTSNPGVTDPGVTGITAGPDGRLWFAETTAGSIGAVTTSGSIVEYGQGRGIRPEHLAAGPDGAIWFTDGWGIGRITTSGVVNRIQPKNCPGCNDVNGVAAGPDGRIWYTQNYYGNGSVVAMTPGGQSTRFNLPNIAREVFFFADAITAGPDGRMWIGESAAGSGSALLASLTPSAVGASGSGPVALGRACRVPNVVGKTLANARNAIAKAGCAVGQVSRRRAPRQKRGRVLSQMPRAGKKLPLGSRVKIVVTR